MENSDFKPTGEGNPERKTPPSRVEVERRANHPAS